MEQEMISTMMTAREFATLKRFSRQRVYQLLQAGRIPGAKLTRAQGVRGGFIWLIPADASIKIINLPRGKK